MHARLPEFFARLDPIMPKDTPDAAGNAAASTAANAGAETLDFSQMLDLSYAGIQGFAGHSRGDEGDAATGSLAPGELAVQSGQGGPLGMSLAAAAGDTITSLGALSAVSGQIASAAGAPIGSIEMSSEGGKRLPASGSFLPNGGAAVDAGLLRPVVGGAASDGDRLSPNAAVNPAAGATARAMDAEALDQLAERSVLKDRFTASGTAGLAGANGALPAGALADAELPAAQSELSGKGASGVAGPRSGRKDAAGAGVAPDREANLRAGNPASPAASPAASNAARTAGSAMEQSQLPSQPAGPLRGALDGVATALPSASLADDRSGAARQAGSPAMPINPRAAASDPGKPLTMPNDLANDLADDRPNDRPNDRSSIQPSKQPQPAAAPATNLAESSQLARLAAQPSGTSPERERAVQPPVETPRANPELRRDAAHIAQALGEPKLGQSPAQTSTAPAAQAAAQGFGQGFGNSFGFAADTRLSSATAAAQPPNLPTPLPSAPSDRANHELATQRGALEHIAAAAKDWSLGARAELRAERASDETPLPAAPSAKASAQLGSSTAANPVLAAGDNPASAAPASATSSAAAPNPATPINAPAANLSAGINAASGAVNPLGGEARIGAQIDSAIQQLTEVREGSRAVRPELNFRHDEFGAVNVRLSASGQDLRASLSSRDPGFVPAIQAALADRAIGASSSASGDSNAAQNQRGHDQSSTQSQSNTGAQSQSGWSGAGSDSRYGSSTGSGQASSQPYMDQTGQDEAASLAETREKGAIGGANDSRLSGLFA